MQKQNPLEKGYDAMYLKQAKRKHGAQCTAHAGVYDYIVLVVYVVADVAQSSSSSTSEPLRKSYV